MTFVIAVAASALLVIAAITGLVMYALSGEKPHGSHARRPQPQGAPDTAGPDDDSPDPFTDPDEADPDKSADEFIAALHDDGEPEPPAGETEPGPPEPPSLAQRTPGTVVIAAPWEPPADRGTLESLRNRLQAWTPAPAAPQEIQPECEPECDAAGENTQQIFQRLVGGSWNPAEMADDIERSVYGSVAASSSDEKDFAGTSLPGLPDEDRDLPQPVLNEAAAQ